MFSDDSTNISRVICIASRAEEVSDLTYWKIQAQSWEASIRGSNNHCHQIGCMNFVHKAVKDPQHCVVHSKQWALTHRQIHLISDQRAVPLGDYLDDVFFLRLIKLELCSWLHTTGCLKNVPKFSKNSAAITTSELETKAVDFWRLDWSPRKLQCF